jgi:hypothetical protein
MTRQDFNTIMDAFEIGMRETDAVSDFRKFRNKNWKHYESADANDLLVDLSMALVEGACITNNLEGEEQPRPEELN